MTLFWIVAALLLVAALAFVLPPLVRRSTPSDVTTQHGTALNVAVYRDQLNELDADRRAGTLTDAQFEHARLELERRLLDDVAADKSPLGAVGAVRPASRASAIVVGIAVPLVAVALYFAVGNPRALAPVALPTDATKEITPQQIEAMVAKLAQRMKQNPDDPQGWAMLAKSYAVMGRFDDAVAAYVKAVERLPNDANLLTDYADALAMAHGQSLEGEPEALIMRALKIDPDHVKSLALAGTIAFDKKDYAAALKHWEKAATLVPADSEMARGIAASVAEARGLAGPSAGASGKPVAATPAGGVSGKVTLAPALAAKAAPNDTLFIFARAAEGPRMPLAIVRKKVSDLPLTFTLDDSMAMSPAARLSGTPQVIVGARISKSGDAMPRPGDLQGTSKPINNRQKDLAIVIDSELP
ncbi:MAG TPA: c-type cytochrome biogenesis protein CcmI [Burkholderiales bacterium]|nr:c-type cytochrome biogenesis protein CcmI [Burkholderiales bacterium]